MNIFFFYISRALKKVGDQTAMAMMGWGAYLSQYQRRTDEEKQELWDEIEPEILIYDLTKKDQQIKELKKANSKIDDLAKQVEEQEQEMKDFVRKYIEKYFTPVARKRAKQQVNDELKDLLIKQGIIKQT